MSDSTPPSWDEETRLGQMSDHDLAVTRGCTSGAVKSARVRRRIPSWKSPAQVVPVSWVLSRLSEILADACVQKSKFWPAAGATCYWEYPAAQRGWPIPVLERDLNSRQTVSLQGIVKALQEFEVADDLYVDLAAVVGAADG